MDVLEVGAEDKRERVAVPAQVAGAAQVGGVLLGCSVGVELGDDAGQQLLFRCALPRGGAGGGGLARWGGGRGGAGRRWRRGRGAEGGRGLGRPLAALALIASIGGLLPRGGRGGGGPGRRRLGRVDEAGQRQFQRQGGKGVGTEVGGGEGAQGGGRRGGIADGGQFLEGGPLGLAQFERLVGPALVQQRVAEVLDDLLVEAPQFDGVVLHRRDHREPGLEVLAERGLGQLDGARVAAQAQTVEHRVVADGVAVRGPDLVEQVDGVAHGPGRLAGQQAQGVVVDRDALRLGDLPQPSDEHLDLDAAEVVALAAAADGGLEVAWVGGGENEDRVGRRLFERLEERVGGLALDLVGLVDQVDLAAGATGDVVDALAQFADVVDAAVGGGVHLDEVGMHAVVEITDLRGVGGRIAIGVVPKHQGLGEDAGGRRLAGAARPGEQVGVRELVLQDRVAQGLDDGVLADDVGEALGAPFVVEGRGSHGGGPLVASRQRSLSGAPGRVERVCGGLG